MITRVGFFHRQFERARQPETQRWRGAARLFWSEAKRNSDERAVAAVAFLFLCSPRVVLRWLSTTTFAEVPDGDAWSRSWRARRLADTSRFAGEHRPSIFMTRRRETVVFTRRGYANSFRFHGHVRLHLCPLVTSASTPPITIAFRATASHATRYNRLSFCDFTRRVLSNHPTQRDST